VARLPDRILLVLDLDRILQDPAASLPPPVTESLTP
jgi:hypothetical protein